MNTRYRHKRRFGRTKYVSFLLLLNMIVAATNRLDAEGVIEAYNVSWDSPSKSSAGSMPVGGHSIGLNVWVEDGDLLFYAQRSGSFDENNGYLKLGRFRLRLAPNPFEGADTFEQELKLREGFAQITAGKQGSRVRVDVWVEAERPVIHVDAQSDKPIKAEVFYEGWRNQEKELPDTHFGARWATFSYERYPGKVIRYPDNVSYVDDTVEFFHRNGNDQLLFDLAVKQQGLDAVKDQFVNTQHDRTFGGRLSGDGFVRGAIGDGVYQGTAYQSWSLRSALASTSHALRIYTHIDQSPTLDAWRNGLEDLINTPISDFEARQRTQGWWQAFWDRSWIVINPQDPNSAGWELGRNYQLFRYQLGCNTYGEYPTKFNGGNFTYDPVLVRRKHMYDPDWRAWGGGSFTAQNQRLLYWPLLKTGDFSAILPQLEFYRRIVPAGIARVQTYWGHEGLLFNEQIENFGLPIACAWGWPPTPEARGRRNPRIRPENTEPGILANRWIRYHYESQLEFSYLALELHRYSAIDIEPYLQLIKQSVAFFDAHYQMRHTERSGKPLDENGKLVIYPSTACETYTDAKNPTDLIAGLHACLEGLRALPDSLVTPQEKAAYAQYQGRLPEYSYGVADGHRVMLPAESWATNQNAEIPQLYPLFPFNRFALGVDDMSVFRNTWEHGVPDDDKNVVSWHQDGIFLARMGMTNQAVAYQEQKLRSSSRRFPTFWGPGHDWVPDHNWGGAGMIGLQEMLMQTTDDKIRLFPAWPREWDVDFKLHAPQNTVIEGSLRDGVFNLVRVSPSSRRADVINMLSSSSSGSHVPRVRIGHP